METKDNTPIWQLTVGELISILDIKIEEKINESSIDGTKKEYVYGIPGLARILGCGRTTAQKIKSSGKINDAIVQEGRNIIIDKQKVFEILRAEK